MYSTRRISKRPPCTLRRPFLLPESLATGATPAIRTQLDLAQGQWVFFDAALQRQTDKRGLEAVATTSERLLEVMNRLTDLYEVALKDVLG